MRKTTKKDIKNYVTSGLASDITTYNFDDMKNFLHSHDLDRIAYSIGTYGINAGLMQDRQTGEFFAITARNSALLMAF